MKYKIAILKNESNIDHEYWVRSCEEREDITFEIIDLTADNWWEQITYCKYDLLLTKPPGKNELFKRLYDERIQLINDHTDINIYPSLQEILIYENKRYLRDWLIINNLPHPKTHVFFNKQEAIAFLAKTNFPVVGKTNIGASGNGVVILNCKTDLDKYIEQVFSSGIKSQKGLKIKKGSIIKKFRKLSNPAFLKERLNDYSVSMLDIQYHYVILQEFIPHDFEWRCVKIGDSFFAHKKLAKKGKTSGTLLKGYDKVPTKLLEFINNVCSHLNLNSVAIDVFEYEGAYLINEIQCFFGQSDPYQMLENGKPGRYKLLNNKWIFEEGMFNTNSSYDLRLEHALTKIRSI